MYHSNVDVWLSSSYIYSYQDKIIIALFISLFYINSIKHLICNTLTALVSTFFLLYYIYQIPFLSPPISIGNNTPIDCVLCIHIQ
ncbi:hypothetical protein BDF14DRAFT_138533 [Spinellus fusiger]|nr:hypothetical protein BDF14DRAFT_138533 [Spinellus fusiger]